MRFLLLAFALMVHGCSCYAAPTDATVSQLSAINLTAAGTRQALSATTLYVTCVAVQAVNANTGVIYVGDVAVAAANGYVLQKGDTIVLCGTTPDRKLNLANIYFDGGTTNDDIKVTYTSNATIAHFVKAL